MVSLSWVSSDEDDASIAMGATNYVALDDTSVAGVHRRTESLSFDEWTHILAEEATEVNHDKGKEVESRK